MYIKLAIRNFRRQAGSYAVYFVTVLITISLLFSVNNIIYCSGILKVVDETDVGEDMTRTAIIEGLTIFSGIIALINSRAQLHILSLRKRELGTYMLLGMKRKQIAWLFVLESTVLFAVTILAGLFLGVILYQGIMSLLYVVIDTEFRLTGYSARSFLVTVVQGLIIFIVSALSTAEVLRKSNITSLIEDRKKRVSKLGKLPILRSIIFILVCVVFWCAIVIFMLYNKKSMGEYISNIDILNIDILNIIVTGIIMLLIPTTIIIFNMLYPRCITEMALRNKKFSENGTNRFILRQLSNKTISNASMFAAISMIVTVVIFFINIICGYYCTMGYYNNMYPCNMIVYDDDSVAVEEVLDKYTVLSDKVNYDIIRIAKFDSLKDVEFIAETTYRECMKMSGDTPVSLDGTYKIAVRSKEEDIISKSQGFNYDKMDPIQIGAISVKYSGILVTKNVFPYTIILPDKVFESLRSSDVRYKTVDNMVMYSYKALKDKDIEEWKEEMGETVLFYWREYDNLSRKIESAPFIVIESFVIITLLTLSMSIIALKITSEIPEDRIKYQKLFEIGVNKKILCKTLFKQNMAFFLFPLIQPLVFTIFISKILSNELKSAIQSDDMGSATVYSIVITYLIIGLVFALYMIITYLFMKKKIITENEQRKLY